jgi:Protein of unknown function (DUF1236)
MKNKLLATVAVAVVVGFGGFAAAQSQMGGESNKATSGATQEKSGGSMSGAQSGSKTLSPSSSPAAQEKSGKDNERLGQGRNEEQKEMTRGAQEEKRGTEQKGAQQERGMQKNQKGAQEERGKNLKGAQEQRGTSTKGAQEERGTNLKGAQEQRGTTERGATEQNGRTGGNTNVGERGERGGSVQLSEDQRSQIKTIVGREHGPRLSKNVNFSISVGTRIPRNVHFAVLPEEIVRIVPQYRGFDYFLVEDEIVIVDPRTLEIVAIIPA